MQREPYLLIRVPHVRERPVDLNKLKSRLRSHRTSLQVLYDEARKNCLIKSENLRAAVRAMTKAWAPPYEEGASHVLVLEDDAVAPFDAGKAMVEIIRAWPNSPINFFCALHYVRHAHEQGFRYARFKRHSAGVAQCLPVEMAEEFDTWHRRTCPPTQPLDGRMNSYLEFKRNENPDLSVVYPAPSIVDHNGSLPSLAGGSGGIYAPCAIAEFQSALVWDWSEKTVLDCVHKEHRGRVVRQRSW